MPYAPGTPSPTASGSARACARTARSWSPCTRAALLAQDGYCPRGEVTMGGLRYNIRKDLCPNSCGTCDQATKGSTRVAEGCADRTITINGLSCERAASIGYCDATTNLGNVGRDICMKSCGYCVPEPGIKAHNTSEAYTNPTPKRSFGAKDGRGGRDFN
ncbi:unnamed protein product [Prorocentrum cordatum]|uniref:ShKT domain-containing protein n=1 Tax=Prorocentrum cordatum TaxID=2364126 RepID=A0ABN9WXL7_9DINO|nr:unnamed protein product [Polarella glacialis]